MHDDGIPRWVEDELWNWSRWCWLGDWPGPGKSQDVDPAVCVYPPSEGDFDESEPAPIPVCIDNARRVNRLYEALPLVEQRVIQAEYPRRREYGDMMMHERHGAAARKIGIPLAYYQVALGLFKQQVVEEFA